MNVKTRRIKPQHKIKRAKNLAKNTLVQVHSIYPVKSEKALRNYKKHLPRVNPEWRMMRLKSNCHMVGYRPRTKKNHTVPMAKDTWALMDKAAEYWGVE